MKIEEIKQKYKDEWVLVEVLKEDELGQPIEVELITHNKKREDTHGAMIKNKEKYTYHFYTGEIPEKGYAAVFYDKILIPWEVAEALNLNLNFREGVIGVD